FRLAGSYAAGHPQHRRNKPLACLSLIYNLKGLPESGSFLQVLFSPVGLARISPASCDETMHLILFFIFSGCCLAGAVNLLLQSHPINSALSLIVVMSSLAVLY